PIDVRGAQVLRAMLAQVDPPPQLAGDVAGRRGAEQVRSRNREDGVQRRPRLRRNLIVSGAPVNSQASRKPLCRYRVYDSGIASGRLATTAKRGGAVPTCVA